ncbi:hypothetical protein HMN09_01181200 [Mycena chlorophos]|uniref:F-box domain-containing protein n=1 Tax=Mycena chlorophos TaxID=658473 RepID=A0A8H6VTZ0_MYCCL|nr:hypothetical protein HMN09_01181200 [Mycena chlorophos]
MKSPLVSVVDRARRLPTAFKRMRSQSSASASGQACASEIYHLPPELWLHIFAFIAATASSSSRLQPAQIEAIRALALTCRAFRGLAQPLLFRRISTHSKIPKQTYVGLPATKHQRRASLSERQAFFLSPRIAAAVREICIDAQDLDDAETDAIFDGLFRFPNLKMLVCRNLRLSLWRIATLHDLSLASIGLDSCETSDPAISGPTGAVPPPLPLDGVAFKHPKTETMDDDALVDLFSLFLAPNRLQRLSSTSAQLIPALALSSKPFTKLLHLEIPASSLHEPSFIAALSLCPSIRRLDIQTERAVSSGSRLHTSIPTTLPPSVLPNLGIYRGPRNYASLFCYRPESEARVHTVELTSLSSAPRLFQTLRSLPSKLENLVIRIDGEVPKTLFSTIHQRFPTLRSLSVNDPVLSFGPLREMLNECAEEGTVLPSLRSLRVRVMGKERYNLWVPPAAEANDVIQMFGKLRADIGSVYPGLTSLKFVHGIENSTVVWRATYPGNELALVGR